MPADDFRAIPNLRCGIELLISGPPLIASRLQFDCIPRGMVFDLPVNGKRIKFAENLFYEFSAKRIRKVCQPGTRMSIAERSMVDSDISTGL